jgi:hypothetical protein
LATVSSDGSFRALPAAAFTMTPMRAQSMLAIPFTRVEIRCSCLPICGAADAKSQPLM